MSEGLDFLVAICQRESAGELRKFDGEHFVDEEESSCYEYCASHITRYGRLPTVDTLEVETGVELPIADDSIEYYATQLVNRRLYNDLSEPYQDLRHALTQNDMDDARTAIDLLSSTSRQARDTIDLVSGHELQEAVSNRYDIVHRIDGLIGIPSGWGTLDMDSYGYQGGDLILWAGRPEMGKTWLLLSQLRNGYGSGANTLICTMEMPIEAVGLRYFSMIASVSPRRARRGMLSTHDEQRLRDSMLLYRDDNRFYVYQGNMGQGVAGLDAVIADRRPDIVYVDGVYLMRTARTRKGAQRNESMNDVVDELKEIALRRNIPIVMTSQLSRAAGGKGKQGSLENIGYTDAFSTHCSLIYIIKSPDRRARDKQSRIIQTVKGREGESAMIGINYKFTPVNFAQVPLGAVRSSPDSDDDGEEVNLDWMRDD